MQAKIHNDLINRAILKVTEKYTQCFSTWSAKGGHVTTIPILDAAFVKAMNFYG